MDHLDPASQPQPAPGVPQLSNRDRALLFLLELQERTPRTFVTWALIAANVAVFAIMVASGVSIIKPEWQDLLRWGSDYAPHTTNGEWWRAFTSMFVHIGVLHIAMNMFVLYRVGPFIERVVGHTGMLVVYLGSGLFGSLASLAVRPDSISAGASGAIFGLFGVLIGFLVRHRRSIPGNVVKSLLQSALLFVGLNLLIGFSIPMIDNSAHIGGLLGGCLLGAIIARPITPEGARQRLLAAIITAVIALALIGGIAAALPRTIDLGAEASAFAAMESTTSAIYGDIMDRRMRGTLSDAEVAQKIETDVLPPWRAAQKHFAELGDVPRAQQRLVGLLRAFIDAKTDVFELTALALKTQDEDANQEAHKRAAEAQALSRQIESLGRR